METPLHSPPPIGKGVFWAIRQDWRLPVYIGFGFLIVTILCLVPYFFRLDKNQRRSFEAVIGYLSNTNPRELPQQRDATLSNANGIFYWRGLVWKPERDHFTPYIFAVKVDATAEFTITEKKLIPYQEQTAWDYGVFIEIPK